MTEFQKSLRRIILPTAVEAATSPSLHSYKAVQWGSEIIDREYVVRRYGERAALCWDDIQASTQSFYREASKYINEQ